MNAAFDEMYQSPGKPRPHWEFLSRSLEGLGLQKLNARRQDAARLLRQNGVTYNVYADDDGPDGSDRSRDRPPEHPWKLDPIPLVIESGEWLRIESALTQRARLLDLILRDLYGAGELIRRGLIPAGAIYSHPGFLRSCARSHVTPQGPNPLITVASDLVRQTNGSFMVVADRAQAPSGAGYALENRIVLARTLPDLYRDARVSRLAVYFRTLRETLAALAPRPERREDPRIVVLTPGPGNETFFEHAFLASYLGYTLVEGSDLTVRQGRVWIQTIEQLEPVDVILRRLDDIFLDPLELKPDSLLGTPGLLQAIRLGNVAIANPAGSGILDNPGLLPYLPGACKHLLGESLQMDSVPTYWCGDPVQRQHVLANLSTLIVKSIFPKHGGSAYFPGRLSRNGLENLRMEIMRRPYHFVGQEPIALSTLPFLSDRATEASANQMFPAGLEARPMVLRTFLLARRDSRETDVPLMSDFVLMPGGLTRVSNDPLNPIVSNQRGGVAKDTWVVDAGDTRPDVALLRTPGGPVLISRKSGDVANRVADNLFWLGRYLERADSTVRILREILRCLLENQPTIRNSTPDILLEALTHLTTSYPGFLHPANRATPENELMSLIYDPHRTGGLMYNLQAGLNAGRRVRDRMSEDGWHVLNTMQDKFAQPKDLGRTLRALEGLAIQLAAFAGIVTETINHGQGWRFLQTGRRIERALSSLSILRSVFAPQNTPDEILLETLLYMKDSLRLYRRRYQARAIETETALDILLLDEGHPQSVGYQVASLNELAAALPGSERGRSKEERMMIEAQSMLRLTELESLSEGPGLTGLLTRLSSNLYQFADTLNDHYLTSQEMPRSVQAS